MASSGSRVKKSCDVCRRYLDHLKEKKQDMTCFLSRMTANFKHSTVVPNRFLKHFAGKFPSHIKLESPNGSLYCVEITERYSKMILRHGWEAFIDAHQIKENDFLLFQHIKNSVFEVLILDSDGCEKLVPCAGTKNPSSVRKRSISYLDISSSSDHDSTESLGRQVFTWSKKCSPNQSGQSVKKVVASSSSEDSGEDFPSENQSFWISRGVDFVLSRGSSLSGAQKERVLALMQEIRPEVAVFVAIMRKSNVQSPSTCLVISKEYAFAHFPHESMDVTLRRPGKSKKWQPRFYKRKDNRLCMLRRQWLDFVRDNHVQEGDICLFLPIKGGRKFTYTVYILRVTASGSKSRTVTGFETIGRSNTEMASALHTMEESTEGENVSLEADMNETSQEYQESDSSGPSEPLYIVSYKSHLSRSQKTIVEATVEGIQSEFPIFVAIMTKSRIGDTHNCRIELGARFAAPHFPERRQAVVLQCRGQIWKTKMVIFPCRRRWFLGRGWPTFVRDNGLRIGDICLFELKKNERKVTMEVHIIFREQF